MNAGLGAATTQAREGGWSVLRRGVAYSPQFLEGITTTLVLTLVATVGRVLVPIAVQQTVDRGVLSDAGPRPGLVLTLVAATVAGVLVATGCGYLGNVRLFRAAEAGLAQLRIAAFRRVHDLSVLAQDAERRGSLVARVSTDVDTISMFVQWGGLMLVLSLGQLAVATAVMAWFSWQLTLVVWACFLPLMVLLPLMQGQVGRAYGAVRERVGDMLAAISESVLGAQTIRAYGVAARTQQRIDRGIHAHRRAAERAQRRVAVSFSTGVLLSGLVVAAVVLVGTWLGMADQLTVGRLLAVLFLVQLFTTPLQMATEVLNELQNALAGWRRVLAVLDTPIDVPDPGQEGQQPSPGAVQIRFDRVCYAYPGAAQTPVLREVSLELPAGARVAVVGRTGSGKSTLARLLVRLMDPTSGRILLNGVDLRQIPTEHLRSRVVLVPQEGFLFDRTVLENIRWGNPEAGTVQVQAALRELGLDDWVHGLPHGLDTPVGPRGESLSAGERQLVALVRAQLRGADLLVLDEATSSVDPGTEMRLNRALQRLLQGRTSVTVAHRMSTAQAADLVVVVADGQVVDVGAHGQVLARNPTYQQLFASWNRSSQPSSQG